MTERDKEINNYDWLRERVLYYTGIDVLDKKRARENVNARVIFCKIAREYFYYTYKNIGEFLGKDHATVIHSVNGFNVIKMYEHKFYKAFKLMLLELEGEELIVKGHRFGIEDELDNDIKEYREYIKNKVEQIMEYKFKEEVITEKTEENAVS